MMATYWTQFAKRGDPNVSTVPHWPAFTTAEPRVLIFRDTAVAGTVPSLDALKVLDAYFAWRRTPAGAAWANESEAPR
jgi:para-nitrobenzyl esterase